jgi:cytochrome c oxidase assembly protein subunit 15
MIVIGGITRLTDSGLSMVDWRPLTGMLPPMNSGDWNEFFSQYRETPEFQLVNPTMSIQEFKSIFWMEYLHRIWGRLIGIVYLLPLIFFITKDMIQKKIYTHLLIILVLGFLQGLLGWMMVKSGLIDRPDVSHYRLTAHLMLAILIYTYLFWILLKLYRPDHVSRADYYNRDVMPIKKLSTIILIFILITLASGGLVAGLDAGAIYNTFPLMGNKLIPNEVMILDPWFINFAENPVTVQLQHRVLGVTTATLIAVLWFKLRNKTTNKKVCLAINCLATAAGIQIILGITTLLSASALILASLHQANAVLTLTAAIWLQHETHRPLVS